MIKEAMDEETLHRERPRSPNLAVLPGAHGTNTRNWFPESRRLHVEKKKIS